MVQWITEAIILRYWWREIYWVYDQSLFFCGFVFGFMGSRFCSELITHRPPPSAQPSHLKQPANISLCDSPSRFLACTLGSLIIRQVLIWDDGLIELNKLPGSKSGDLPKNIESFFLRMVLLTLDSRFCTLAPPTKPFLRALSLEAAISYLLNTSTPRAANSKTTWFDWECHPQNNAKLAL